MKNQKRSHVIEPTDAEIQHVAYWLWLESDRASGRELDHWLEAKELLKHSPTHRDAAQKHLAIPHPVPASTMSAPLGQP